MSVKSKISKGDFEFPEIKPSAIVNHCKIIATASHYPEQVLTTEDIITDHSHSVTSEEIREKVGTDQRRVAPDGMADSDLLSIAAEKCLKEAGIEAADLSKIIVTKFLGDRLLPMTASMLQSALDCPEAVQSYDIDGGTNCALQAIDLATKMINMGDQYILIVSGGINYGITSRTNENTAFLFGDGASAMLLGPSDTKCFESSYSFTNYEYSEMIKGCARLKALRHAKRDIEGERQLIHDNYEIQNWDEAVPFLREAVTTTRDLLLKDALLTADDIDLYLITENSKPLWKELLSELDVKSEKSISLIEQYGNTQSAMLPSLIDHAIKTGRLKAGQRVMALSIGEGINAGGMIYKMS